MLSSGQRSVVAAISVDGHSIGEVAEGLGMSEGAVRVALHRGLVAIARHFGKRMDTNKLVKALVADLRGPGLPFTALWWVAVALATVLAAVVFYVTLGPRPDIAEAVETPRFLLKFVVTVSLAAAAFGAARALSRPGSDWRHAMVYLTAAPAVLLTAVAIELVLVPPGLWGTRLVGTNSLVCLTFITLIGAGPLIVLLAVLRHGAPTRSRLAGAVAGLLAGSIAATFYAAQCTDDSPLFVATWYTIAIAALVGAGALAGGRFLVISAIHDGIRPLHIEAIRQAHYPSSK